MSELTGSVQRVWQRRGTGISLPPASFHPSCLGTIESHLRRAASPSEPVTTSLEERGKSREMTMIGVRD